MKKIIRLLDWLYAFRIRHLFVTAAEARGALAQLERDFAEPTRQMQESAHALAQESKAAREKFRAGVLGLTQLRIQTRKPYYELQLSVHIGSLETEAGPETAAADIALMVASKVVERHQKTMQANADKHEHL